MREEETLIRYPLRKKPRVQESKTYTLQPRLLTRDQWLELDRLEKEFSSDEWARPMGENRGTDAHFLC